MVYPLSREQALDAWNAGLAHDAAAKGRGAKHHGDYAPTAKESAETTAISKVAEAFVAATTRRRHLSLGPRPDNGEPDVEGGIETRHTKHANGHLMIWEKDKPERPFVLIVGKRLMSLRCAGWLLGVDCRRREWWKNKGELLGETPVRFNAWFVPQECLHDAELSRLVLKEGEDPNALLARLADPGDICRWVGESAFGIRYNERGDAC